VDGDVLSDAVVVYLGYGVERIPAESDARLIEKYGDEAEVLGRKVKGILSDLNSITPDWSVHSLDSGTKWALEQLKRRHGNLSADAMSALGWAFSWWWR